MKTSALTSLAFRGLTRNRRRSLMTLLAIALGFAAIALFAGYTHNVYRGLSLQAIHGELLGHLTLSKRGMSREGKLNPERYLLTGEEIEKITAITRTEPQIKLVAPRLVLSGIISNGRASTIFIAEGIEPAAAHALQAGLQQAMPPDQVTVPKGSEGKALDAAAPGTSEAERQFRRSIGSGVEALDATKPDNVALAAGLAALLHLTPQGKAALLTNTLFGQANALDVTVGGVFNTGNAGTNDLFAFMPLALVRSLYDAEGRADRLSLLLDDMEQTDNVRTSLLKKLTAAGMDMEIHTWNELSAFYNQVRDMFDMIFGFIFIIVITVVTMSVANSMGMTVVERTREIGTLRAIGLNRRGVVRLFTMEAGLLILLGCTVGLLLTLAVRYFINRAGISYVPPNQTSPVPLLVDFDMARIVVTVLMMAGVGILAAWIPARRAARQPIIDALGHV